MPISILMSKIIFKKYLLDVRSKLVPKFKMLRIYSILANLIFWISQFWFWCQNYSYQIFTACSAQIGSKIKITQNLLKFGTFNISNIPISILISKIIFMKYLPPVRPKLVAKLKVPRIYWNLAHLTFQICRCQFQCKKWLFSANMCQLIDPHWSQNKKCSEFIEIWLNLYFKYADLDLDVKKGFY